EDTVLLDAGPGVELLFAKNSIGAVLSDEEYNQIVHGIEHDLKSDGVLVPDDASSLTGTDESSDADASEDRPVDCGKKDAAHATSGAVDEAGADAKEKKRGGGSEAK